MTTTKTAVVKAVRKIDDINSDAVLCEVEFDTGDKPYFICPPNDMYNYLDKMVDYSTEKNIHKNELHDFILTIAEMRVVNTINRSENIKLFADVQDTVSNTCFADIDMGQTYNNCILYCQKVVYDSSIRADWLDITASDKLRRVAHVRLFSPTIKDVKEIAGRYIRCDIRKTKFGFTTDDLYVLDAEYAPNPEIDIAEAFIWQYLSSDEPLKKAVECMNLIPFMKEYVGYERGSLILECAMEVDLALELANVTSGIDTTAIIRALFAEKLWCTQSTTHYSKEFVSLHKCLQYKDAFPPKVQDIIGGDVPTVPEERLIFTKVKELVKAIVITRKGNVYD